MAAVCNADNWQPLTEEMVVGEIFDNSPGHVCLVCAFFYILKRGYGLFRPIVNLRPVNRCIRYEDFKVGNLNSAWSLLWERDYG